MQRRSFLAGILAGATAPAIVRASSLMKIWVPPQEIVRLGDVAWDFGSGDFTTELWYRRRSNGDVEVIDWRVREVDGATEYARAMDEMLRKTIDDMLRG